MASKKPIKLSADQILYQKAPEGVYPICRTDWNRIKSSAQKIQTPKRHFHMLYSICIGLFTSSAVTLIAILQDAATKEWFRITMICIVSISLIAGIVFYIVDSQQKEDNNQQASNVIDEMETLEKTFISPVADAQTPPTELQDKSF